MLCPCSLQMVPPGSFLDRVNRDPYGRKEEGIVHWLKCVCVFVSIIHQPHMSVPISPSFGCKVLHIALTCEEQ